MRRVEASVLLGVDGTLKRQLVCLNDHTLVYTAGHNIIEFDTDAKTQRVIAAQHDGPTIQSSITAFCVSPDRKYIAIAVRGERAVIVVYDAHTFRKRKVLSTVETISNQYVSMAFSADGDMLLTQAGSPDYSLINWDWEEMKPMQVYKIPVSDTDRKSVGDNANQLTCSYCPHDPSIVVVSGRRILHFLGIQANSQYLVPLPINSGGNEFGRFVSHGWTQVVPTVEDTATPATMMMMSAAEYQLLLMCEDGNFHLYDVDHGFVCEIPASSNAAAPVVAADAADATMVDTNQTSAAAAAAPSSLKSRRMSSLNILERGFVVGTDTSQLLFYYYPNDTADYDHLQGAEKLRAYAAHLTRRTVNVDTRLEWQAPMGATITNIVATPREDMYMFTTGNGRLLYIRKSDTYDAQSMSTIMAEPTEAAPVDVNAMPLYDFWHTGAINGMDTCRRKPFVVTCGSDHSVRVWNYDTQRVEVAKTFNEEPLSVSFHPTGHYVIVGFVDKLRLMNVMMNDVRAFKELPVKNCRECRFSHGGHLFAAAQGKYVMVYNFHTCEKVAEMRVHGAVRSITWSHDDQSIITAGMDGAVYEQKLYDKKKSAEWVQKTAKFYSATQASDHKIYVVGDDGYLKEVLVNDVTKQVPVRAVLTQVVLAEEHHVLFVGTETGIVRAFKYPLTGEACDVATHNSPITRMSLTPNGDCLFVASDNGVMAMFILNERDNHWNNAEISGGGGVGVDNGMFSSEVLLGSTDLEEQNALMTDLKSSVDELTVHNAYQLRLHDINYQEQLKETTERYNLQLEQYKSKYEMLQDEKQDLEVEYEDRIKGLEDSHSKRLHELDLQHQQKIMEQVRAYHALEQQLESGMKHRQRALKQLRTKAKSDRDHEIEAYESLLLSEEAIIARVQHEKDMIVRKFAETKLQLEDDTDREIEELRRKYEHTYQSEREATLRLQAENGIMKKKFSSLRKDIEDQREEIKVMSEKEGHLYKHIQSLQREIENHITQIEKRDRVIGEKETEIYDLKKDNQELEKNKFVLDFQIKDLKRQIEPRDTQIQQLKNQILSVDHDLESFHYENAQMTCEGDTLKKELTDAQTHVRYGRHRYRELEAEIDRFEMELELVIKDIQDPQELRASVTALLHTYVPKQAPSTQVDPDVQDEYERQKGYLQHSVQKLQREMAAELKQKSQENVRIMQENVALIKDINELRRRIQELRLVKRKHENHRRNGGGAAGGGAAVYRSREDMEKIVKTQLSTIRKLKEDIAMANHHRRGGGDGGDGDGGSDEENDDRRSSRTNTPRFPPLTLTNG